MNQNKMQFLQLVFVFGKWLVFIYTFLSVKKCAVTVIFTKAPFLPWYPISCLLCAVNLT